MKQTKKQENINVLYIILGSFFLLGKVPYGHRSRPSMLMAGSVERLHISSKKKTRSSAASPPGLLLAILRLAQVSLSFVLASLAACLFSFLLSLHF